jgi:RNA polymerase sigma-70 factor (ECF subfamily)
MEERDFTAVWPQTIPEFEALIDSMQHRLIQFAWCRLRSRADAEDVVQEVLVRAYRDRHQLKGIASPGPFLFRMVANRCTDLLRSRKHQGSSLDDLPPRLEPSGGGDAEERAEADRARRSLEASLERLPLRQSEAIRLRLYADLPFEAVAQAMGCSVPTVKSRFRYGIEKLRRVLKKQGGVR